AINATLYGSARLSYTIATEGELPDRFERITWNEPIGLHVTAGAGLAIAVALPLTSISAVASAVFLAVFTVVNLAAFRASRGAGVRRTVAATGAMGCAASLVVLVVGSATKDPVALIVLVGLLGFALGVEHLVLKRRPQRCDMVLGEPRHG
ncbi:hypothetical protein MNBD_ACTINO01-1259, partial [hydrothermal vent metagenome]